jgi:hypothetical protein
MTSRKRLPLFLLMAAVWMGVAVTAYKVVASTDSWLALPITIVFLAASVVVTVAANEYMK